MIAPDRIVRTYTMSRKDARPGYLLAVVPPHDTPPPTLEAWVAREKRSWIESQLGARMGSVDAVVEFTLHVERLWQARPAPRSLSPLEAAEKRWRSRLWWYVAEDLEGQVLLRSQPFTFPADPRAEGLYQERLMPDGIKDVLGASEYTLVTTSDDPAVVARWWWAFYHGNFPRKAVVRMSVGKDQPELPRTAGGS